MSVVATRLSGLTITSLLVTERTLLKCHEFGG
jgi:hypothetical protein